MASTELPEYYFRVRENGAFVFRVDTENRQRRIDMDQIAVVNVKNGEIKPQGDRQLTEQDMKVISDWMAERVDAAGPARYRRHPPHHRPSEPDRALGELARHRCTT